MTDDRKRNFAFVVYPDSAPSNWLNILGELKVPCLVSPIHDKDVNPDGELKKAHYHVLLMFEGKKSLEQVLRYVDGIPANGQFEEVKSLRGYARYLCHLDNPEKYQYSRLDVLSFGGADYDEIVLLASDKLDTLKQILMFIEENDILSFRILTQIIMEQKPEWFGFISSSNTIFIKEYLKSRMWDIKRCNLS